ncbi:MAG TPA: CsgG/HfaB family protein [Lacunisphaera sp.]|jgi:hypothetical protein
MKIRSLLLAFSLLYLLSRGRAETPYHPLATAVFDIEVAEPSLKTDAGNISALLNGFLSAQESIILVERQQLESVLGEQSLGAAGFVASDGAAKVGQLTGAKVIVLTRMFSQSRNFTIMAKIIGTETGRVFAEVTTLSPGEKQNEALQVFAEKIAKTIRQHGDELVAKPETPDDRAARLLKLMKGHTPVSVSVSIPEQHISHRLVDPAAETEIANILGQAGFVLVTNNANPPASYQIVGEGISESSIHRGDFISCSARVEVKVLETGSGRILLQDRQTEVAVAGTESIAAKTALQKAGARLAERIVARLAALK